MHWCNWDNLKYGWSNSRVFTVYRENRCMCIVIRYDSCCTAEHKDAQLTGLLVITEKNKLVVLTTEWLPQLQKSWRDSGYESFALVLETNCIRQPSRKLPSSSYNHNTLTTLAQKIYEGVITNALQSCSKEVVTRKGKHSCYEGLQCMYCGCKMNWVHRRRNRSGWSGHGRTILSRSWDIITRSTFVWSRIAVVKFGRYVPKCARIRLTFSMTKLPGLRIPVWSWSAMRAPSHF